jgi:hypothetical protein
VAPLALRIVGAGGSPFVHTSPLCAAPRCHPQPHFGACADRLLLATAQGAYVVRVDDDELEHLMLLRPPAP